MGICFVGDWAPVVRRDYCFDGSLIVGNLECAFAKGDVASGKAYASILSPTCLDNIASAGFTALSVANNHAYDAGEQSFRMVVTELERRGVIYFGTRERPYVGLEDDGKKIAVIGCLEPCRSRGPAICRQEDVVPLIKRIREDFHKVYIYPHWGKEGEYTRYPSPMQRKLARCWIDAGADGVFGNHAHVPQGMEEYKGKPIYYSIGNFDFPLGESEDFPASRERMAVKVDAAGNANQEFKSPVAEEGFAKACSILDNKWSLLKWARYVGPVYLSKNMESWNLRLKKSFWKTLPKFLVWQFLPKTLLFRIASCCK